jgi:phage terminase Nu1 subunit (DNA packaging protein)
MPKSSGFPEVLSTSSLASLLGLTPQRLGQLAVAGIIQKAGRGAYPASAVASYCEFLRQGAIVETQDGALDLKQERARLVAVQRRLAELELARVEARIVDVTIIGAELTAEFSALKSRLRGIASKVAPQVTLMDQTALVAAFILKEIDIVLDDLSSEKEIVQHAVMETRDE